MFCLKEIGRSEFGGNGIIDREASLCHLGRRADQFKKALSRDTSSSLIGIFPLLVILKVTVPCIQFELYQNQKRLSMWLYAASM